MKTVSYVVLAVTYCVAVTVIEFYWLQRLHTLVARFSHLNLDADMASRGLIELWALCCFLSRLAAE